MRSTKLSANLRVSLQKGLLGWFSEKARDLPWRKAYDPYHVWLSEVMLQQTQMDRVLNFFHTWLEKLPTVKSVSEANEEQLLKLWEGLGYYSRVRNFQKAAKIICREYSEMIPESFSDLIQLPGIGKYTAGAISSIAFQKDYPVVDGNVERVYARLFTLNDPVKSTKGQKRIWSLAHDLLPKGKAREWNQAVMELGALVCKKANPNCPACPLTQQCQASETGTTSLHPVVGKSVKTIPISFVAAVIIHKGKIYTQKRLANSIWGNLWEFPGGHLERGESPEQGTIREVQEETCFDITIDRPLPKITHSYTKYKATVYSYVCRLKSSTTHPKLNAAQEYKWLELEQLDKLAFSAGHRKLIELLKTDSTYLGQLSKK